MKKKKSFLFKVGKAPGMKESMRQSYSIPGNRGLPRAASSMGFDAMSVVKKQQEQVKSSHLYLYSAFNNTNCVKATAQYQNGKIVSIM